ncbi:DUF3418 domain-containing protein [Schaalia sp. lx-100]|uniref:DUF3418 domain-containing protein n=1 Tax=Schaalia sp. lx-100 TaxID=2899081 RepID=UPI002F2B8211
MSSAAENSSSPFPSSGRRRKSHGKKSAVSSGASQPSSSERTSGDAAGSFVSHRKNSRQQRSSKNSRRRQLPHALSHASERDTAPAFQPFTAQELAARVAALPVISFPDLPVCAHRDEIAQAIRDHQVVIVAGETGSGKTTQLPKICLSLGRGITGMIGHTQPRRIAARSVADRIAEELGQSVGSLPGQVVGYQVRFTDEVGPTTLVKLMTDGILLAEIQSDPLLRRYDTLIIDEAHERSLNIDFILGYIARLLPVRPDLKVIITSATIDSERFAAHFGVWEGPRTTGVLRQAAPIISVSGRTFPVEIRYRPLSVDAPSSWSSSSSSIGDDSVSVSPKQGPHVDQLVLEDPDDDLPTLGYGLGEDIDIEQAICHAVDELCAEGPGDILVFLPGERDIRDVEQALKEHLGVRVKSSDDVGSGAATFHPSDIEIIPLFARLSAAEQHRVFEAHQIRRIVLSTNVAETSLTVPDIRYVIDPGLARISRYSHRTKVQRLPIEPVSQASANQRAGRCGRVADGVAIRLYSQHDYESRPAYTEPEILRTSLASVILHMTALGLGSVADFPFLDAPDARAVRDGIHLLVEIGALAVDDSDTSGTHRLTPIGRDLSRLPVDPRLGRMLLEAEANGCSSDVLVIVAALSIQDVRERPLDHQQAADTAHARFVDPDSDFITYLNLWRYLHVQQRELSGSAFRRMCRSEFLHYLRFREWRDVVTQLRQMARPLGIGAERLALPSLAQVRQEAEERGIVDAAARASVAFTASAHSVDADQIHRSLLVGLLSNIGAWDPAKREYAGARGTRFSLWPGSGLAHSHPEWVMTAELVETSRLFARTVARIQPEWIESAAGPLLKRMYGEPYWSSARGAALVTEKVLLYGVPLAADRPVLLGRLGDMPLGVDTASRSFSLPRLGSLHAQARGLVAASNAQNTHSQADEAIRRQEILAVFAQADPSFPVHIHGADFLADATSALQNQVNDGVSSYRSVTGDVVSAGEQKTVLPDCDGSTTAVPTVNPVCTADAEEVCLTARQVARSLLIRHGLVRGQWRERHNFLTRNSQLISEAREVEKRSRTHGLVADEDALVAFFDDLIPERIISAAHFSSWWKKVRRHNPDLLIYPRSVLLPRNVNTDSGVFPDHWICDDMDLPLRYEFSPGSQRDGVTMVIPVEVLPRVREQGTDWLVSGLFTELVIESIRALPKAKRRLLTPAPDVGATFAQWMREYVHGGPGTQTDSLSQFSGQNISGTHSLDRPTVTAHTHSAHAHPLASPLSPSKDPSSLSAAMDRLAAWGQRTGHTRASQRSVTSPPVSPAPKKHTATDSPVSSVKDSQLPAESHVSSRDFSSSDIDHAKAIQPCDYPPFSEVFVRAARVLRGVALDSADLAHMSERLPQYLRMTFVVIDRSGRELDSGKDLVYLQKSLEQKSHEAVRVAVRTAVSDALYDAARRVRAHDSRAHKDSQDSHIHATSTPVSHTSFPLSESSAATRISDSTGEAVSGSMPADLQIIVTQDGLTDFPEAVVPDVIDHEHQGMSLRAFPALVAQGTAMEPCAGVRLMASRSVADRCHREGLARLLLARLALATKRVTTRWSGREALMLAATSYGDTALLVAEAQLASAVSLVDELCGERGPSCVREAESFELLVRRARDLHEDRVYQILGDVARAMEAHSEYLDVRASCLSASLGDVIRDTDTVVNGLLGKGFVVSTPITQLPHIARYVRGCAVRLRRVSASANVLARDLRDMSVLHDLEAELTQYQSAARQRPYDPVRHAGLVEAYWMIQELRVSLFAQQLGTAVKVSAKRIIHILTRAHEGM